MRPTEKQLAAFLSGKSGDAKGRTLNFMIKQDDNWWENNHDFIQWMFPTDEESRFVKDAPKVAPPVSIPYPEMMYSYARFREFLTRTHWIEKGNHNCLRVSRVLRSLMLFGHEDAAQEFLAHVKRLAEENPELADSVPYWEHAARKVEA